MSNGKKVGQAAWPRHAEFWLLPRTVLKLEEKGLLWGVELPLSAWRQGAPSALLLSEAWRLQQGTERTQLAREKGAC